jgi:uncharacterized protein with HEPN domain
MPSKNPAQRLADIIDNIDAVQGFTAGLDFPAFRADRKAVYAVVRALEIVSEASRRLPDDLLRRHPEIDWAAVAAAGNVYRHEYEAVDEALIWHTRATWSGGPTRSGRGRDASFASGPAAERPAVDG